MRYGKLLTASLTASLLVAACSNPLAPRFPQPSDEEEPPPNKDDQTSLLESQAPDLPAVYFV